MAAAGFLSSGLQVKVVGQQLLFRTRGSWARSNVGRNSRRLMVVVKNMSTGYKEEEEDGGEEEGRRRRRVVEMGIGSPIIVVEAPKMLKTAASVPCLRVNSGLVNPGDVGRIVSRKPKDVWAIRLTIGTYLIDGKYFKPLDLDDD